MGFGLGWLPVSWVVLGHTGGWGQQQVPAERNDQAPAVQQAGLFEDLEISNYLKNAEDGVARKDWKYAVDCLQRIIDHPGNSLVTQNGEVYESGRLYAQRRLAALGAEGLGVYRLLYDGSAKATFAKAVAERDEKTLGELVRRFLLTSTGDDAADLLASWFLDEGRCSEASSLLRTVLDLYPDSDIPQAVLKGKLAVALALGGQVRESRRVAEGIPATERGARPAEVLAFIEEQSGRGRSGAALRGWTMLGGGPSREGQMDAVEPTFVESRPVEFELPVGIAKLTWANALQFMAKDPVLPVFTGVTDGRQVLVRCQDRVVSLDAESLEPIWMSDPMQKSEPEEEGTVVAGGTLRSNVPSRYANPAVVAALVDQIGGLLSLVGGRAYMISREGWPGGASTTLRLGAGRRIVQRGGRAILVPGYVAPWANRLVALDASVEGGSEGSGQELWSRGGVTGDTTDDPLAGAEFSSVPIGVGDHILATYRDQASFNAAILSPEDGSLVKRIPLCDLVDVPLLRAVHPAMWDQVVYIPSNQGILFAVDGLDYTLRWASRYPKSAISGYSTDPVRQAVGSGWLDSPPVVAGEVVILACADSDELLGFDRLSGRIRWRIPRGAGLYLLGTSNGRVFVGGDVVMCVDASAGTVLWRRQIGRATGRGALSGGRIYLPTTTGLVCLDVNGGQVVGQFDLPPDGAPFGNLLCWDGAMYSLDVASVRKYHDVKRSYEKALAANAADPTDGSAGIRLAWLELLQDRPERAVTVLDRVVLKNTAEDHRRAGYLAHLKVEARVALVSRDATPTAKTMTLLEEALQAGRSLKDRTRVRLLIVEHLAKLGRPVEAAQACYELVVSPDGEEMIEMSKGWECRAKLMAPKKVEALLPEVGELDRVRLQDSLHRLLAGAIDQGHGDELGRIGEGTGSTGVGQAAWLALGRWWMRGNGYAAAESCLRESVRCGADPQLTAEALAELAILYGLSDVGLQKEMRSCLTRLVREFAGRNVSVDRRGEPVSVGKLASELGLEAGVKGRGAPVKEETAFLKGALDESWRLIGPGRLTWIDGGGWIGNDRFVMLQGAMQVVCRSATTGGVQWDADLVPSEGGGRVVGFFSDGVKPLRDMSSNPDAVEAARSGQMLVAWTESGLFGVDLVTGKRLWSRSYPLSSRAGSEAVTRSLDVDEGRYVLLPSPTTLEAGSLLNGSVLWRREVTDRRLVGVKLQGDFVLAVDHAFETLCVYARADGSVVTQCRFAQPSKPNEYVSLAVAGNAVCGPDELGVVGYDLSTGKMRWRLPLEQGVQSIFRPSESLIGVGTAMGYVNLVESQSGKVVVSLRHTAGTGVVVDGVLEGDVLVLLATRTVGGISEDALMGFSMSQGKPIWSRLELPGGGVKRSVSNYLRLSPGVLPVVLHATARRQADGEVRQLGRFLLLDKRTGQDLGTCELTSRRENDILTDELLIGPGRILVGMKQGIVALSSTGRQGSVQ